MAEATKEATSALVPSFDLETYIGRYNPTSETRLQRLLFIGERSSDQAVSKLAYELAERQMKECGNVRRYKEVFGPRVADNNNNNMSEAAHTTCIPYDAKWVAETDAVSQSHLDVLQGRLSSAQSLLNKEAIRAAYLALGEFHRKRGELREALRAVLRSRDYCTSRAQTGHVCLLVIEMAIDCRDYPRVRDYAAKAHHTNIEGDVHFPSKPKVASGLACLADGRYWDAAQKFTSISGPPLEDFTSVVSTEDVALYGAILGLATMTRSDLCSMLEPPATDGGGGLGQMAAGLELVPPVRDALLHFKRAEYKACLSVLQQLKPQLQLDLHLSPHLDALFDRIRNKCLVEYLKPYRRIHLEAMGNDFGLSPSKVQSILAGLIQEGQITNARIDCRTRTLTRETNSEEDTQRSARRRVSQLGDRVLNETHAMIIRLACLEQDLVVKSDSRRGGDGGGARTYWNEGGGFEDMYDGDESSDDGDTPMVDLVMGDHAMNPEDLY